MEHSIEAFAIDEHHLELKGKIPPGIGNRFFIHIFSPDQEKQHQFELLEKAYLAMSEAEIRREKQISEEGIINLEILLYGEEEAEWWK